jgi:uncharacterized protein YbjT (DUF2867 family)
MILVAGGTGTLGTCVVRLLAAQGHAVRVLTRDPRRATDLPAGVEILTGDVRNSADLATAVNGCKAVVSAVHGFAGPGSPSPESIDRDANCALIRAASGAGVAHFILMSVFGAAPDHPMSLHRAKYAAEQELRASGLRFTIIRPTAFLETWLTVIGGTLARKGHALVFGPGHNPINLVSVRDVAALVALALVDEAMRDEIAEIGGPENLAFITVAERLIEASGKPGRIKHVPLPILRAMSILARPFAPVFARQASAAVVMNTKDMTLEASARDRFPSLPSTTLEHLLKPSLHP